MEAQYGGVYHRSISMGLNIGNQTHWYESWRVRGVGEKYKNPYWFCLSDSILLNVSEEKNVGTLWKKLGDLCQDRSLVNIFFR